MNALRGFLPVTTYGDTYPLDNIIRPFLPRVAQAQMVSFHYAKQQTQRPALPTFVDSGGFALVLSGSHVRERPDVTGVIIRHGETGDPEVVTPEDVLGVQRRLAHYACPLDFPTPPSLTDEAERGLRLRLTLANARWLLAQATGDLVLYGAVQGWDADSYEACARDLVAMGYRNLAIGGLVPRLSDLDFVEGVVRRVRAAMPAEGGLHLFGVGQPGIIARLLAAGASSTDSSSYVKAAADGRRWDGASMPDDPTPLERAHAAIANARMCAEAAAGAAG